MKNNLPIIDPDELKFYAETAAALVASAYQCLTHDIPNDIKKITPSMTASVLYVALDYLDSAITALDAASPPPAA